MAGIDPRSGQAGPRRLARQVPVRVEYYPSEEVAEKTWPRLIRRKFDYSSDAMETVFKVRYVESPQGFYITGILHPACTHFQRPLEDSGVLVEIGHGRENWPVGEPPDYTRLYELQRMKPKHGGRKWL